MSSNTVRIYTDGSCIGNPGPGGWGVVLIYRNAEKRLSGGEEETTNNRMELQAVIEGLKALKRPCHVEVYTDSQYLRNGMTKWMAGWLRSNWRTSGGGHVKNVDLWSELNREVTKHIVSWNWVAAHKGDTYNEIADREAKRAAHEKARIK